METFQRNIDRRRAVLAVLVRARPHSLTVAEVADALRHEGLEPPDGKRLADLLGGLVASGRAVRPARGRATGRRRCRAAPSGGRSTGACWPTGGGPPSPGRTVRA